ncbi:EamA family transporter [Neisseria lisongii]|uniref:EamA family transporter n=1 Tax=Neisseria lisongii TaxID=2912188 RepID=A0AAW5ANA0_9NEIS|nr:EamA family transporter [Neisseria lisongii]MCF7528923.1 EamA family transporter [Neisseria lisongii]
MPKYILFLLIAAIGNTAYHLGQKSLHNQTANPMLILAIYYLAAMIICLTAMPFFGSSNGGWKQAALLLANTKVWLVALGIILIELGFLLAYQAGGSAQWSGVAVNGMAALLLIPLSIFLFHESFSWNKLTGIILTLLGLYVLVKK